MKSGLYYIVSAVSNNEVVEKDNWKFINELGQASGVEFIKSSVEEMNNYDLSFVFVGTGGTENEFKEIAERLPQPVFLISTPFSNSLAASMEILAYCHQNNIEAQIIHGSIPSMAKKINDLTKVFKAINKVTNLRLARIGVPSDWLISSDVDAAKSKEFNGIEIIDIPMDEFYNEIKKHEYPTNKWVEKFKTGKFDEKEKELALYIYGALRRLVDKYELNGVTVRCFDLLEPIKSTGCVGLAILNAEGIYASCEGDTPALISMAVLGELTGEPVFMCNPSEIDVDKNEIIFAHCTLPLNMIDKFELMTHYESSIGVAFRGHIPEGDVTVFKTDGLMNNYFVSKAELLENLSRYNLCRTQIRLHMDESVDYFLTNSISNHHLVIKGDYVDLIDLFFEYL